MRVAKRHYYILLSLFLHFCFLLLLLFLPKNSPFQNIKKTVLQKKNPEQPVILTTLVPYQGMVPQDAINTKETQTEQKKIVEETISEKKTINIEKSHGDIHLAHQKDEQQKDFEKEIETIEEKKEPQSSQPQSKIFAMTRKLLQRHQQEANSYTERKGENRMPTFKELKFLSYQKKVDASILRAWNIVRPQRSLRIHRNNQPPGVTVPDFFIKKDGTLTHLKLLASSGDKEFDDLVLKAIQKAAPFPPIPDHLGINVYKPSGGKMTVSW